MYNCEVCGKVFNTKRGFHNHCVKSHPDHFEIFQCECCSKKYLSLRALSVHVAKTHYDILTVDEYYNKYLDIKCKLCGKKVVYNQFGSFCNQQHYETYHRKLNNNINFNCELCECGYETIGSLTRHLTEKHPQISHEEYYLKYLDGKKGYCLWCNEPMNFVNLSVGYNSFCYNKECNVLWNNKNTNRLDKFSVSMKETLSHGDVLTSQLGYWIKKGYSQDEAIQKLNQRQTTFNKEICIEKYGHDDGIARWKERQKKWTDTLNNKDKDEIMRINRLKVSWGCNISKDEKELCKILKCEHSLVISKDIGYVYDIYKNKKIIEYNGDYWHCNPIKYPADYYNQRLKMTASEKWKKDKQKNEYAKNNGYDIKIVWEHDYKNDKDKVIKECLEFLNE